MSILARLFSKRAYPPEWLVDALNLGTKTSSGITVTETTALKYTAFYSAVDLIARGVGQLPLHVYERVSEDERQKRADHPLYGIIHTRPAPELTAYGFFHTMQAWACTWGNAYAEIVRGPTGRVQALYPIRPDVVTPKVEAGNRVAYKVQMGPGDERTFDFMDILHIRTLGDALRGYSPVRLFANTIGLSLAAEKFGEGFFGNSAQPAGILKHPHNLTEKARKNLRDSWNADISGDNAHGTAVLEEGMEWIQVGVPPEDAQFLQTRKFQVSDIARIFHVPLHKLAELERATFSNIEHQSREWLQDCLGPWLKMWEQEIDYKLFVPQERARFYSEFLVEGLLRGDIASRYQAYAIGRNWGWLSADDIRRRENMNPLPDDQGKIYLIPKNMGPADEASQGDVPAGAGGKEGQDGSGGDVSANSARAPAAAEIARLGRIRASCAPLLLERCRRIVARELTCLRRLTKKPAGQLQRAASDLYLTMPAFMSELLGPPIRAYAAATGDGKATDGLLDGIVAAYMAESRASGVLTAEPAAREQMLTHWAVHRPGRMTEQILDQLDPSKR